MHAQGRRALSERSRNFHAGMNILITGGTGSFGQAFVKRLLKDGTARRIVIYSRNEPSQAEMREKFNSDKLRFFIGDIRDRDRLRRALDGVEDRKSTRLNS